MNTIRIRRCAVTPCRLADRYDRQYTVWDKVAEGMEHIDTIKKGGEHNNGAIFDAPDKIVKMRIEAEAA
jgi:cyclophilin family peptidyl-prolyl cis-trans isomerase